ncbi:tyrosine-type recombinase/integrase [Cupriavidus sp. YR651]|uniref:tyrosine-type recombinase/integrase n=1 Tax=Cupriavidus sp. YR651 TaxID=1855315 RepID=UPI0015A10271|nr:tyrosine-type recombinase/integrase [Cupriavidus sp. YR651]
MAIHIREVVQAVFRHAQARGQAVGNPAEAVRASAVATFKPRDRALTPAEICKFIAALQKVATTPTLRLALKFVLLTGVRKGEFIDATWSEVDFDAGRWTIPASHMKARNAHVAAERTGTRYSDGAALLLWGEPILAPGPLRQ